MCESLLGDAQGSGELDLRQTLSFAGLGDALAELHVERFIGDGHGGVIRWEDGASIRLKPSKSN